MSPSLAVLWHELECGSYRADLPLWRTLAEQAGSPVLDLGAGTGRVALDLAERGHEVVALDHDPELIGELRRRAGGLPVEAVVGDVRGFDLGRLFALVIVPMQTLQLLAGPEERGALLRAAAAHLAPEGLFAAALADPREAAAPAGADVELPTPDVLHRDGWVYASQPLRVALEDGGLVIERERSARSPGGARTTESDRVWLAGVDPAGLEREGAAAGLLPSGRGRVNATDEHVGSDVVILRHA